MVQGSRLSALRGIAAKKCSAEQNIHAEVWTSISLLSALARSKRNIHIICLSMVSKLPLVPPSSPTFRCPKCYGRLSRPRYPKKDFTRTLATISSKHSIVATGVDFSKLDLPPPSATHARIVPASPSYFTGRPRFTDSFLDLQELLRKYLTLPLLGSGQTSRVLWKNVTQYRIMVGEPVRESKYQAVLEILKRLNQIQPEMMPKELKEALKPFKRHVDPFTNMPNPGVIDEDGRACGIGRRKSSSAKVYLVQGNGEVLINGKSVNAVFGRIHDRESALWALKATSRMDKYNVWALVSGGGTTGQAEAITLGLAKALMVHEPMLKPALRRGTLKPYVW